MRVGQLEHVPARQWRWLQVVGMLCDNPVFAMCIALIVYGAFAIGHGAIGGASVYAYFNYLADAFLHGQAALRLKPHAIQDLSFFHEKYYLYWPPFPAVLLMPFVAMFGVGFSDIIFTLGLGSVNVALVALLLREACRQNIVQIDATKRGLLVLFFAFGTVHLTLAPYGRVWFTAQLVGFACVALAYLATLRLTGWPAFLLAGCAIGAAFLTRNHLIFIGLWPAYTLIIRYRQQSRKRLLAYCAVGLLPVVFAVAVFGWYNWLRFGNVSDNGLAYHAMTPEFRENFRLYGAFNLHYVATNLYYQYVWYPIPIRENSFQGGSLFLMGPVFFAIFWAFWSRRQRWSSIVLLTTIVLVAIPITLLMGTGWVQWGPRYTLDFTVPLLLLTARGIERWSPRVLFVLVLVSIAQYARGTYHFMQYL